MGFIGSLFNSSQGAGFQAQGTNQGQLTSAQDNVQTALNEQQDLVNALNAQNGIGKLSSVYGQLQGIANGTGPNPAQAMLNNATGQNNAAQAALMASNRGASANAGLIARQAAYQGAANQQDAIGQGAALQAQQSLGALGQMGNIASQQTNMQQQAVGNLNQFQQANQGQLLGMMGNQNSANAGIAKGNQSFQSGISGGLLSAVGNVGAALPALLSEGGQVPTIGNYSMGSVTMPNPGAAPAPQSKILQILNGMSFTNGNSNDANYNAGVRAVQGIQSIFKAQGGAINGEAYANAQKPVPGKALVPGDSYANDTVPAKLSPGEIIIPRSHAMNPQKAAEFAYATVMKNRKGK